MAFCPHCGKSVSEQATQCAACGKAFDARGNAARFKGTMVMAPAAPTPASTAEPAAPVQGEREQAAPAAPAPAPSSKSDRSKPAAPAAAAPGKPAKQTMLGTGGIGLAPPAPIGETAPTQPAPPAAGKGSTPPPARPRSPVPPATEAQAPAAQPSDGGTSPPSEDSQRFLLGDPMAPPEALARKGRRGERGSLEYDAIPTQRTGMLLAIGVTGLVLIAALGYFTAHLLGLTN